MVRTHKYIAKETNTKYNRDAILHHDNTSRESYLFWASLPNTELLEQTITYKGWGDTNVVTHDHVMMGKLTNDRLEPTIDQ